jgi:hypothetical protein
LLPAIALPLGGKVDDLHRQECALSGAQRKARVSLKRGQNRRPTRIGDGATGARANARTCVRDTGLSAPVCKASTDRIARHLFTLLVRQSILVSFPAHNDAHNAADSPRKEGIASLAQQSEVGMPFAAP